MSEYVTCKDQKKSIRDKVLQLIALQHSNPEKNKKMFVFILKFMYTETHYIELKEWFMNEKEFE